MFNHERLRSILTGLTVHLVEASPALSVIQQQTLTESSATPPHNSATPPLDSATPSPDSVTSSSPYQSCTLESYGGVEVHWYRNLEEVPKGKLVIFACALVIDVCFSGFSYFFAHEFLDALPIHQFQVGIILCTRLN